MIDGCGLNLQHIQNFTGHYPHSLVNQIVEEESVDNLALPPLPVQGFPFAHLGETTPRT